jgi:hypothetical protein
MHTSSHRRLLAALSLASCLCALPSALLADAPPPQDAEARLTGVWRHMVTFRDCDTGDELRPAFPALNTFHKDNTASEQGYGVSGAIRTASHGYWRRSGARSFVDSLEFYVFDSGGILLNRVVMSRTIEVSADGKTSTATGAHQRYTLDGLPTLRFCVTEVGERLPEPNRP